MKKLAIIPQEIIQQKIYFIRGERVMFDRDLAELYGVETFNLNKAVKRNRGRFPKDFMFQLTMEEADSLRFQFGILKKGRGQHTKYAPYVFTEPGVAMLSSVLNSKRAIQVNIQIIRTFIGIRKMIISNKRLREKVEEMEKKYDKNFKVIFQAIKLLLKEDKKPPKRIGFCEY